MSEQQLRGFLPQNQIGEIWIKHRNLGTCFVARPELADFRELLFYASVLCTRFDQEENTQWLVHSGLLVVKEWSLMPFACPLDFGQTSAFQIPGRMMFDFPLRR